MAEGGALPEARGDEIVLHKDQILGTGGYGQVCKAEYHRTPCAAKMLHPTLRGYDTQALRHHGGSPLARFTRECAILRGARHPNVIQYLCSYRDPDSGVDVLVMELMEDNLTHYLEEMEVAIHYCIQIDICHDVAQALVYLHDNGIFHRDLSSNNILLNGKPHNIRAKVTDFGMAQLVDGDVGQSLTRCPGTEVYMPPEAVQHDPRYTDKIDCFSFGVNIVQILTRQFPNPGDRYVRLNDPRYGGDRVMRCVPEVDRRHEHISLIRQDHPLLWIALQCLRDNDVERPSAKQLCEQLTRLKNSPEYADSIQSLKCGIQAQPPQWPVQIERRESYTSQDEVEGAVNKDGQSLLKLKWRKGRVAPCRAFRWCDAVVCGTVVYFRQGGLGNLHINYSHDTVSQHWDQLPRCPLGHPTLVVIDGELTAIGDKSPLSNELRTLQGTGRNRQWNTVYPPMPTRRYLTTAFCNKTSLIVAGGLSGNVLLKSVEVMDRPSKQWSTATDLPLPLTRCSTCLCGDRVYVLGGMTVNFGSPASVITCSLRDLLDSCHPGINRRARPCIWNRVADLPVCDSTCVSVNSRLLAIGGRDEDDNPTTAVREYHPTTNTWEVVSQMNTARFKCFAAALLQNEQVQVMVVGGAIRNRPNFMCTNEVEFATITSP